MLMLASDIHVFKAKRGVTCARRQFFDYPSKATRLPGNATADGLDHVRIEFAAGGHVDIFTDKPLVWVEPERH